eukprot:GGOE01000653.1.p1 GENE.GGOE01000653.1~~GGOE01000653.1.p1  ORF type:complete len:107 (+),score=10.01 GGOE01000653.1:60-380(+)
MTIPHTPKGRKAFLKQMKEEKYRERTKEGKPGPWKERKLECKAGPIDSHVFGYCLRNSPNKILYHHGHPAHGVTKRFFYKMQNISVQKAKKSLKTQVKKEKSRKGK